MLTRRSQVRGLPGQPIDGDLGVRAARRNVTPQAPVRARQITPEDFPVLPHPCNEFVVNAIAAGEARESSLARSAWNIGWARTAARERWMLDGLAQR